MSLDDIEHGTIRKQFQEPRIHFAIVCASLSCPRLQRDAFVPARLTQQLQDATRQFFSERRNLEWDARRGTVTLTSLLKWYRGDFVGGGSDRELLNWIALHLPAERAMQLKAISSPRLAYRDYDWAINDPGSRARAKDPAERELR
jgi:succinate dehydrogenase flavin-adding protein (antitoxin of CptAB toxin-antitoxin module)